MRLSKKAVVNFYVYRVLESEAVGWINVGLGVFLSDLLTNGQWDVYFNKYCSKFLSLIMT